MKKKPPVCVKGPAIDMQLDTLSAALKKVPKLKILGYNRIDRYWLKKILGLPRQIVSVGTNWDNMSWKTEKYIKMENDNT